MPTTDADIVRASVRRAGRAALIVDTALIEAEINRRDGLASSSVATLRRHLADCERAALLYRLDSRLPVVFDLPVPTQGAQTRAGVQAPQARGGLYLLAERVHELRVAAPDTLDDLTRTAVALQLAQFQLGGQPAPTRLVTHVLHTVPALHIRTTQDTNVLLQHLVNSPHGLASRQTVNGRSVRWSITGRMRGAWLQWVVAAFNRHKDALEGAQRVAAAGAASHVELAATLVAACTARRTSAMWPAGRPVSMREISAELATVRLAADSHDTLWGIDQALATRRGGVNGAIHDATRSRYADGTTRRHPPVLRVAHPEVTGVAYTAPVVSAAMAPAWLLWQRLKEQTGRPALTGLGEEWRATAPDEPSGDPPLAALQACQRVAVAMGADALRDDLHALLTLANDVSQTLRDAVDERRQQLVALRATWPTTAALQRDARRKLRALGFTLDDVLSAERPQITSDAYAALLPSSQTAGLAPSVLVANLSGVRRDRSVDDEASPTRVGSGRAARLHLDRVDALIAAVETAQLPGLQPLTAAGRMLGRRIAHVPLVRRLAASAVLDTRLAGLAALVLLGDIGHVETLVQRRLRDPRALDVLQEGAALVELAWWFSQPVRDAVLARAHGHPAQVIARAAREVRMAAAGRIQ